MTIYDLIQIILLVISLPTSIVVLTCVNKHLKMFQAPKIDQNYIELKSAPSVSVCIPVRNEDQAIRDCLERVLSSNYPKLEVIVLDDESVDKTPEIVRIFARDGVRFIKGEPLSDGWIGKNKAVDQLLNQASGKYALFMSADTDIEQDSISKLVDYALRKQLDMVCVMPIRKDGWRFSAIFDPLRYFWTVLYHANDCPAHTTAAWLVNREVLLSQGGFEKYKRSIKPELLIARDFLDRNKYRFLISDLKLGFSFEKKWSSQTDTSVRITWPFIRRDLLTPLLFILLQLVIWMVILYALISSRFNDYTGALLFSALLVNVAYGQFSVKARPKTGFLGFFLWPIKVVQELILIALSGFRHEFSTVVWKGRRLTDHID